MPPSDPTRKRQRTEQLKPHSDDEAEIRAGIEEAARGELLSTEESEAYVAALVGDESDGA